MFKLNKFGASRLFHSTPIPQLKPFTSRDDGSGALSRNLLEKRSALLQHSTQTTYELLSEWHANNKPIFVITKDTKPIVLLRLNFTEEVEKAAAAAAGSQLTIAAQTYLNFFKRYKDAEAK